MKVKSYTVPTVTNGTARAVAAKVGSLNPHLRSFALQTRGRAGSGGRPPRDDVGLPPQGAAPPRGTAPLSRRRPLSIAALDDGGTPMSSPTALAAVAVVLNRQHGDGELQAAGLAWPRVGIYTVGADGSVTAVRGPRVRLLADLKVRHVVWAGVPSTWALLAAKGIDPAPRHHFVGRRRGQKWHVVDAVATAAAGVVEAAVDAADRSEKKEKRDATVASREAVEAARRARLALPPPWYVPEGLL